MPGRSTHSSSRRAAELADSDVDAPEHATSPGERHGTSRQVFNQDDVDIANYKNASSASGNANVGATTIRQPIAAHPQLCIIETPLVSADLSSFNHCPRHMHTEYRIYNWRRLLSGRIIRGDETEKDLLVWAVVAGIAYLLRNVSIELWRCVGEGEVLGTGQVALSNVGSACVSAPGGAAFLGRATARGESLSTEAESTRGRQEVRADWTEAMGGSSGSSDDLGQTDDFDRLVS